jgi:hypothetical protein
MVAIWTFSQKWLFVAVYQKIKRFVYLANFGVFLFQQFFKHIKKTLYSSLDFLETFYGQFGMLLF